VEGGRDQGRQDDGADDVAALDEGEPDVDAGERAAAADQEAVDHHHEQNGPGSERSRDGDMQRSLHDARHHGDLAAADCELGMVGHGGLPAFEWMVVKRQALESQGESIR
jgi:hypothetical protein